MWLANQFNALGQALIKTNLASLEAITKTAIIAEIRSTKKGRWMRLYIAEYDALWMVIIGTKLGSATLRGKVRCSQPWMSR